ncbi:MAG: zinc ribbon domain-containing protein [Coriobacteriia bacterium]|nr:zinc ribbon domain-containing protein [Coriobacteriia bacterium]
MALHSFTRNYNDLSSDAGFQYEFYCDCCGNGYKSSFIQSKTYGRAEKIDNIGRNVGILGNFLGGKASEFGWAAERAADVLKGRFADATPEWRREQEETFDAAQEEVRPHFRRCPSCNKWVCTDCWNAEEGLCTDCAPRESAYVAKARNEAMRRNIDEKALNETVWTGELEERNTVCPSCGGMAGSGKFCNSCGAPLTLKKCSNCGAAIPNGMKFCGECGTKVQDITGKCPSCGFENPPGTKFCGECGTKL